MGGDGGALVLLSQGGGGGAREGRGAGTQSVTLQKDIVISVCFSFF